MKEKYIPGEGCQCSARCSCECGCDVDWTPREVYELREQRDMLLEEREQWRMSSVCRELSEQRDRLAKALWSMLNQDDMSAIRAGILLRSLGLQSPTNPNEL
jgi:hypothetical protein